MNARDILLRPVVSEKSYGLAAEGKFTFQVAPAANKIMIREAIEEVFPGTHVTAVNTLWVRGKSRRLGRLKAGHTAKWKKAIVTLRPGETIELFETG